MLAQNPATIPAKLQKLEEAKKLTKEIEAKGQCVDLKMLHINGKDLISIGFVRGKAIGEVLNQLLEDISEDGYYGVKETSNRLVSFAKALSNSDPAKADKMIEAVKKGFEAAKKAWGGELPEICQQTVDETIKQLEEWKNSGSAETK